jgi:hypothetical protein
MYTHNSHIDITRLGMKGCRVLQRSQQWRPQYGTYHKLPSLELGTPSTKRNNSCQYEDKILTTLGHLTIQDLQHILRSIWEKQYAFLLYTLLQLDRQAIERQPNFEPLNLMTGLSGLHQNRMILDTTGALTTTYYDNSEVLLSRMKTKSLQS